MSYNVNLVPNIAPQGTVMQYTGATDPSGWVICDGQARSNTSGFYNNILTSQLVNVPNANTTVLTSPLNTTGKLLQGIGITRVAINGSGNRIMATYKAISTDNNSYAVVISNDYGITWQFIRYGGSPWYGLNISNDNSVIGLLNQYTVGTNVFFSSTYGTSYFSPATLPNNYYSIPNVGNALVMSGDGKYAMTIYNSTIYISANYGSYFSTLSASNNITGSIGSGPLAISNAISSSGYYVMMVGNGGAVLFISTNSGNWWTNNAPVGSQTWNNVALSATGQYMLAGSNTPGYLYLSSTTGSNWITLNSSTYGSIPTSTKSWKGTAISYNGNYMIATNGNDTSLYISSNYGAWWTTVEGFGSFYQISYSANSNSAIATNGTNAYLSTNNGYSWAILGSSSSKTNYIRITYPIYEGASIPQNLFSLSNSGNIMLSSVHSSLSGLWLSTNSGNSWSNNSTGSIGTTYGANFVAVTNSGTLMYAIANNCIHVSTNMGSYWSIIPNSPQGPGATYNGLCCSGDGTKILASQYGNAGYCSFSTDSGNTWKSLVGTGPQNNPSGLGAAGLPNGNSVTQGAAISNSGSIFLITCNNTGVIISTNYGTYWRTISGSASYAGSNQAYFAAADNGIVIISGSGSGSLYISTNYGISAFKTVGPNVGTCGGVSISGTGTNIAVTGSSNTSVSTDFGTSWSVLTNTNSNTYTAGSGINISNDGNTIIARVNNQLYVSNQAFSPSTYYSTFTPMNIASTTTTDGTTLKYIMKY